MANEINPIVSEEYADLVVEASGVEKILQSFPEAIVHPINFMMSLVNIPVAKITNQSIQTFGYSLFPGLIAGLASMSSLEASNILKLRGYPSLNLRGQGVLIGILDTGIDYTNPIFQNADGTTRIAAIWDQTIESGNPPENFSYGTEYTQNEINQALQSENFFEVVPSKDEIGHGTMVAGIAGGNEVPESDFYGIATEAEFVIVKMKIAKEHIKDFFCIPKDAIAYQENDIAFAYNYLVSVSTRLSKPLAICNALSSSEGAHYGHGTLNSYLSLVASMPGIACIIAAGNEGNSQRHYFGISNEATGADTVELYVGENASNFTMYLWGTRPNFYSVDIISPSGEYISGYISSTNSFREIRFIFEKTIIYFDYQISETQSADTLILFRVRNPASGIWKFIVHEKGTTKLGFHIWLPVQGLISDNIFFIRPDPYTTVSNMGTATVPITVAAYNHVDNSLYLGSGRGYSRTGLVTPQIAAPGVNIVGPTINHTFSGYTGTGISAAHVTGVAAMVLEWAIVKENLPGLSSIEMKIFMERGAQRELSLEYPNREWGYGILDIYNVFDSLRIKHI
ncbi:MAG: S8 family peptidase [Anaerocolumna sp.]